ncbi:MAG: hypothetical protein K2Y23_23615, partial [Cyanobacteria bacterium]|nr:hypothetical protein [Cyanobacteriota bacterium]
MARRLLVLACVVLVSLAAFPISTVAQQPPPNPTLDAPGFREQRDYFSQMPFEHIDALSGALILTFTDLVLPGDAGRELRLQHSYNSKTTAWTFGIAGIPLRILNPPPPPVVIPPEFQQGTPTLYMADGAEQRMAWYAIPNDQDPSSFNIAISSNFLKFDRTGTLRRLKLPNGDYCDYETDSGDMLRVSSCTDVFGNVTSSFDWRTGLNPPELHVTHIVGADSRLIVVTLDPATVSFPWEIKFGDRTWSFDSDQFGLSTVTPPVGPPWRFSYQSQVNSRLVSSLETPQGGSIEFVYETKNYTGQDPSVQSYTLVVTDRTMFDRGAAKLGSWHYDYFIGTEGLSGVTTITASGADDTPTSRTTSNHGSSQQPDSVFDGSVSPVRERTVERPDGANWVVLEKEERTYQHIPVLSWANFGTLELLSRKITRKDGGTDTNYLTELTYSSNNFGDYHRPKEIVETPPTGANDRRTTTIEYDSSLASDKYILGLPTSETVKVGTEEFIKSWTYDSDNGFRESETIYGIETKFGADANGNVAWLKKGNDKTTLFQYRYGQPKLITTPLYSITRSINSDGSIASETKAGRTTQFTYDKLGRATRIQPPGSPTNANDTLIEYDNLGGETVRTSRGPSQIIASLDGFGRQIQVVNNVGVVTNTTYDAEGRVIKEGYPFTGTADKWTEIEYDALGRVTSRKNPDTTLSRRAYGANGLVIITDENDHQTLQTWKGFGSPDDAQLVQVIDAKASVWTYTYNTLGKLRTVSLGGTPLRAWTYYEQTGLLKTETHPESELTQYFYEDLEGKAGNLTRKTDAKNKHTSYEYDSNDRVKRITADGRPTLITYESGSDNRTAALNGADGVTWRYDGPTGRLAARQDYIDGKSFSTTYEYDGNDNVNLIQYPSGRRIEFEFNAEGQPTRVFEAAASRNYASSITYHASSGVASYTAGNGVNTTIAYHSDRYWTTNITAGSLQIGYSSQDYKGNPRALSTASTGSTFNLKVDYDELDRLKLVDGPQGTTNYGYDAHGNRNDGTYDPTTLRLTNHAGTAFLYDNNGNATTIGTATFTYTPQNQVETAATPGFNVTYGYDADEQRVKKVSGGSSTYYIRGGNGELLTEWKDPGTSNGHIRDYIYLGGRLLSA